MESVIVFGIFRHLLFNGSLFLYERLSAGFGDALYPIVARVFFLKRWAINFAEKKQETLQRIDDQIAELHSKHRVTFYTSLGAEFFARVLSCAEIYFILSIFTDTISYWDCILILAFTSLFANALFFLPMQLGGREGGFALAVGGLSMPYAYGVYMGLIMRLRELVWIILGIGLMKFGNKNSLKSKRI